MVPGVGAPSPGRRTLTRVAHRRVGYARFVRRKTVGFDMHLGCISGADVTGGRAADAVGSAGRAPDPSLAPDPMQPICIRRTKDIPATIRAYRPYPAVASVAER